MLGWGAGWIRLWAVLSLGLGGYGVFANFEPPYGWSDEVRGSVVRRIRDKTGKIVRTHEGLDTVGIQVDGATYYINRTDLPDDAAYFQAIDEIGDSVAAAKRAEAVRRVLLLAVLGAVGGGLAFWLAASLARWVYRGFRPVTR